MKNPKENSLRWLRQAEFDLNEPVRAFEQGSFAYAAFFAEQAAQKSLKAFLIAQGERWVMIHSVGELVKKAAAIQPAFKPLIDAGKKLDRHYLASRYPDALPEPAIPAESYSADEAKEARAAAQEIFRQCQQSIDLGNP